MDGAKPVRLRGRAETYLLILGVVLGMFFAGIAVPFVAGEPVADVAIDDGRSGDAAAFEVEDAQDAPGGDSSDRSEDADAPDGPAVEEAAGMDAAGGEDAGQRRSGEDREAGGADDGGAETAVRVTADEPDGASADVNGEPVRVGALVMDLAGTAQLGFDAEVLSVEEQEWAYEAFAEKVNDEGGIHGRPVELVFREWDPLDQENMRRACLELTQDEDVFVVMAGGGFVGSPVLCITEENDTPFITDGSSGMPQEFYERSNGLLFTSYQGSQRAMWNLAHEAAQHDLLEGVTAGIIFDERSGPESVAHTLQEAIEAQGGEVGHVSIFSEDLGVASSQVPVEVQQHRVAGVDVIFNTANALVLAQFTQEANTQGYNPDYVSYDWNGANSDFYYSGVPNSFDGNLTFTVTRNYEDRADIAEPARQQECRQLYEDYTGEELLRDDDLYGSVQRICNIFLEMGVGGLRAAGSQLSNETFSAGMQSLGQLDMPMFSGGLLAEGRFDAASRVRTAQWQAGCGCLVPISDFRDARY